MSKHQSQKNNPEVSVYIAMSLDGFIAKKDHDLSWLEMVKSDGEDYGYANFMDSIDAIFLGRNTYDTVRSFGVWPYSGKKVFVFTNRPIDPILDETAVSGNLKEILENLNSKKIKRVYLDGGNLIQQGIIQGVVNSITLSIIPILLGDGIPLFGNFDSQMKQVLKLQTLSAKTFPSGLVQLKYNLSSTIDLEKN